MGRELQKKKKRSSIPKIKLKPKSKRVNPLGNPIIAENWNQAETLTQNYRRLGLASRLNSATGGIEKQASKSSTTNKLAIANAFPTAIAPTEARVERDPETGKIMRVIHSSSSKTKSKPLNDPLNSDSEDEKLEDEEFEGFDRVKGDNGTGSKQEKSKNEIIQRLEEQAQRVGEKKPRRQSEREKEWIERLVERWGEDYAGMVRDRRLNPMQQTEGDIRRRVGRWREDRRVV